MISFSPPFLFIPPHPSLLQPLVDEYFSFVSDSHSLPSQLAADIHETSWLRVNKKKTMVPCLFFDPSHHRYHHRHQLYPPTKDRQPARNWWLGISTLIAPIFMSPSAISLACLYNCTSLVPINHRPPFLFTNPNAFNDPIPLFYALSTHLTHPISLYSFQLCAP